MFRLFCRWNFPGKNTGVEGIFPTQGSNSIRISYTGRWILYHCCHLGNPYHPKPVKIIGRLKVAWDEFCSGPELPVIRGLRASQSQLPEDLQRELTEWDQLHEDFPVCNLMLPVC